MGDTKKIGVFTIFYRNHNYGATLQAYALQKKLIELGYNASVINFIPNKRSFSYRIISLFRNPKKLYRVIRKHFKFSESRTDMIQDEYDRLWIGKISKWDFFCNKYIESTKPVPEKKLYKSRITDGYDILIVGSDQVWNPQSLTKAYLLPFKKKGRKKIAYAASISVPNFTEKEKQLFIKWLPDFDYITVRENEGKRLLESFLNMKIETVLDPTFLLMPEDWNKLVEPISLRNQVSYRENVNNNEKEISEYILFVALGTNSSHRKFAEHIAEQTCMRLKILSTTVDEMRANSNMLGDELVDVSPNQYLYLIKNASIVITDSFHALVFSINFRRNFYVLRRDSDNDAANMNSRIYTLLGELGLENQLVDSNEAEALQINQNLYRDVDEKLNLLRKRSENILLEMLNK